MTRAKKLIVVGGGAAGFFCAVNAARLHPNLHVIILEKSSQLLTKVKVSGGGRCNVTHAVDEVSEMLDAYPRGKNFMRKTLHAFSTHDTEAWFLKRGIKLKTEDDGRMFPETDRSQSIIDCLMTEAQKYHVEILQQREVEKIERVAEQFIIHCKNSMFAPIEADFVCIAIGGQPKLSGFNWLTELGLTVEAPVPSLFTFNIPDKKLHSLMGVVAKDAIVKLPALKMQERGPVLITHWGLSGPAVLKLSSRGARDLHAIDYHFELQINWTSTFHESSMLEALKKNRTTLKQKIGSRNPFDLTSRLWEYLLDRSTISAEMQWTDLSNNALVMLARVLTSDRYEVKGKTTFKEEFVTAGGLRLSEIDPLTRESKKIKGLFFAGEILDVDGITGGYNFQHAWSSGFIAAQTISLRVD
jgi:predicted Rossmann fold flavoprotein